MHFSVSPKYRAQECRRPLRGYLHASWVILFLGALSFFVLKSASGENRRKVCE
jgi:hypothetical protein